MKIFLNRFLYKRKKYVVTHFSNVEIKPDHKNFYAAKFSPISKVPMHFQKMDIYKCPKSETCVTF